MSVDTRVNVGVIVVLVMVALGQEVRGQSPSRIGTGPVSHISVAVRDAEATARAFAEVLDIPVPAINSELRLAAPDGSETAGAKVATMLLSNFLIEIQQPVTEWGPIHDTVEKFGPTIHHISFGVSDSYGEMRDLLVQKGGQWRGGTRQTTWSYVDFRDQLGTTFEPISLQIFNMLDNQTTKATPGGTLGSQPVTRVGIVVKNADEAARAYADILGVTIPPARVVKSMEYPEGSTASRDAHIKVATWTHENGIAIELIEPVGGPSPWSEALQKQRGNAVHHLTFGVGNRLDEMIRLLQAKGGKLTYGRPGGTSAYLDFTDKLGIVIEVTGTAGPS